MSCTETSTICPRPVRSRCLINHSDVESLATEPTILGPFYMPASPDRDFRRLDGRIRRRRAARCAHGTVRDENGQPIPGACLDVWQNAANGVLRSATARGPAADEPARRLPHDDQGRYEIRSVRPVPYPIPADGPVDRLLADTGCHRWRAAHIHARLSAAGFEPLTTHLFDRDSDYRDSDAVFGVKDSLIRDFILGGDDVVRCESDFVLRRVGKS